MSKQSEWEAIHDQLMEVYRLAAREKEQGYDREATRTRMDALEKQEHAAYLAFRDSDGGFR